MSAIRATPVSERARIVVIAMQALGHDLALVVNGKECGKLRALSNDWTPQIDLQMGGSNMLLKFVDGKEIPAEHIRTIAAVPLTAEHAAAA